MEPLKLAIVGCGGMGRRHLAGLGELKRYGIELIDLVAVCDLNEQNALDLAEEARDMLHQKPLVFTDLATMIRDVPELEAADCTTDSGSHHVVAAATLDLGLHTLCEKPLALTIRGCKQVIAASNKTGKLLSVAENYRRDPMNRLVKALLDQGAIGEPQLMIETTVGGRDEIFITPWRHQKLSGTITLDAGVHNADILQFLFGNASSAFGRTRIIHSTRHPGNTAGPGGFYEKWADTLPSVIQATGEDALFGLIEFENGAVGQWIQNHAGHGAPMAQRVLFGSSGSITAPGDRNGNPVSLTLDSGDIIDDESILDFAPDYELDPVGTALFHDNRPWTYDFSFAETDRKLLAMEYAELAECVRDNRPPEVDGDVAMRAVALVYAVFESQLAGRPVMIEEIESGSVDAYQQEIDKHYGLVV